MYIGILQYEYHLIDSVQFDNMYWNSNNSNYMDEAMQFIDKHFELDIIFEFRIKTLLSLVLENIHDHGSGSCNLRYGLKDKSQIIEVFESNGGFDLNQLPHGNGGCGFREMQRNKSIVSHSADGKSTFLLIESEIK